MTVPVWTVGEVNRRVGDLLDIEFGRICVEGEVSGLKIHDRSGHAYFGVKDPEALLSCVCWASTLDRFRTPPSEGMKVKLYGRLKVYERRGSYQLVVDRLDAAGEGDLQAAFLALKRKLEAEGLFSPERKRVLPRYPLRIGVVTSASGAALQDVLRVLKHRWPVGRVFLWPADVQGAGAVSALVRGIERFGQTRLDLLIVTRGGGSLEDLAAFNDEAVARAIADSQVPTVVGVGHETDTTIADFVADVRAATPSQAAEISTPDQEDLQRKLSRDERSLRRSLASRLDRLHLRLQRAETSRAFSRPEDRIRQGQLDLDRLADRLRRGLQSPTERATRRLDLLSRRMQREAPDVLLAKAKHALSALGERWRRSAEPNLQKGRTRSNLAGARLKALGPKQVLARGYSIVRAAGGGPILHDAALVDGGDFLDVHLYRGELHCRVETRTLESEEETSP